MTRDKGSTDDYTIIITGDTEERAFLRSTPWILDAHPQNPDSLSLSLRHESSRLRELPLQPKFSLLTAIRDVNPQHLGQLILSLRCQSYQRWELLLIDDGSKSCKHLPMARRWADRDPRISLKCLEKPVGPSRARNKAAEESTGDYLMITDDDGVFHPMALGIFVRLVNENPNVNFMFANEVEIDSTSTSLTNFVLKPPFDLSTVLRIPYVGRPYAVDRGLLMRATGVGPVFRDEYDGVEEHDLILRLARTRDFESRHSVSFIYYRRVGSAESLRRSTGDLEAKRRRLLDEHLLRLYQGASWTTRVSKDPDPLASSSIWITGLGNRKTPRLLVVIGFKDQVETTIDCLESIERQEHRLDVLVALVNNRSTDPGTLPRLRAWISQPRAAAYEILNYNGAFNFARINNWAIARLGKDRDLVLLLNNDVELTTPQCLQIMAMQLLADPTSGFVGIKLYYPNESEIQHGGIRIGPLLFGSGLNEIIHARSSGEFVDSEHLSLGVTFACAMARRETFERLGGLDEVFVPNGYGDVEMCLRALEAGYRNFYLGSLSGIHHESKTRGMSSNEDLDTAYLYERRGQTIARWRLRHLHRSYRHAWPLLVLPLNCEPTDQCERLPPSAPGSQETTFADQPATPALVPLRYRVADEVVGTLKRVLGPAYGIVRGSLVRGGVLRRRFRTRGSIASLAKTSLRSTPILGPISVKVVRQARGFKARSVRAARLIHHALRHPAQARKLVIAYSSHGFPGFREELSFQSPVFRPHAISDEAWFRQTRPSQRLLAKLRRRRWPKDAPKITILMPVYNVREDWLRQAIESVLAQTYPHWELICVDDGSPAPHIRPVLKELSSLDSRVVVIHSANNRGVSSATNLGLQAASGDYVSFMDHDDYLEPHALQRFAEAILHDNPDMLYSDEVVTGEDINDIIHICARSKFSYDYYVGHPYIVHLITVRGALVRQVGGLHEGMSISQDVDLNLRLIEVCKTIGHIPEVLYRWREHGNSLGHQKMEHCRSMSRSALNRHFGRTGQNVALDDETNFNFRNIRFYNAHSTKVAILVTPPGDPYAVRDCISSLRMTNNCSIADVFVANHPSCDDESLAELGVTELDLRDQPQGDPRNLPAIINGAVAAIRGPYTHYIFLSPAIRANGWGWLGHMLGYACRKDVGVVGALLVDDDEVVRHAGIVVGIDGSARNWPEPSPYLLHSYRRNPGPDGTLLASREVSAVSAACMLTRADVFHRLSGFDECFATALHDVDYCLRAQAQGYKTILDAYAVLCQPARAGQGELDIVPGRQETEIFRDRYRSLIIEGDPFSSPSFSRFSSAAGWNPLSVPGLKVTVRTVRVVLPSPLRTGHDHCHQAHLPEGINNRPHFNTLPTPSRSRLLP